MAYDKKKWKQYLLSVPIDVYKEMTDYNKELFINDRLANIQEVTRVLVVKGLDMVKLEKELERLNLTTSELLEKLKSRNGL